MLWRLNSNDSMIQFSVISSKRESIPPIKQREDTDLSQDVRKVKESTPSRLNATNRISKLNEPNHREEYGQMEDGVLTRSVSQPKLSKRYIFCKIIRFFRMMLFSGPSQTVSISPIGKQNKWASMPWLARQPSFASSMTSEYSQGGAGNAYEGNRYRQKYQIEKEERKNTLNAYSDLQQEFTSQAKELAEAKQTIDQLRLGANVDLYGKPPVPGEALHGTLPQSIDSRSASPVRNVARPVPTGSQHNLPRPNITDYPIFDATDISGDDPLDDPDYDEVRPLNNTVKLNQTPVTPQTAKSTPHFARENNQTVLENTPKRSLPIVESTDLDLTEDDDAEYISGLETDLENELVVKGELHRTDLLDKIDHIDDSIRNYNELVKMDQINLDERDGALKNLEQNTRKLEKDYTMAKSDVGDKILDPNNDLSGEIIRIGKELADLKRQLEKGKSDPDCPSSPVQLTGKEKSFR